MKTFNNTTHAEVRTIRKGDFVSVELTPTKVEGTIQTVGYQFETIGHLNFHQYIIEFVDGQKTFFRITA